MHDTFSAFPEDAHRRGGLTPRHAAMRAYYRFASRWATRHARALLTPSQVVKDAVAARFGLPTDRITVTPEAPDPIFHPVCDATRLAAVRQRYALPPGYVLAIASKDSRKNLHVLLRAYAALDAALRARHPLAVILTDRLDGAATPVTHIHWISRVTDDELCCLYSGATLFVFPSSAEGFGLPMVEAMACGVAVIATTAGALPEVAGGAAALVPPNDSGVLTATLHRLLTDTGARDELRRAGLRRAADFSWARCAEATRAVYERVGGGAA